MPTEIQFVDFFSSVKPYKTKYISYIKLYDLIELKSHLRTYYYVLFIRAKNFTCV